MPLPVDWQYTDEEGFRICRGLCREPPYFVCNHRNHTHFSMSEGPSRLAQWSSRKATSTRPRTAMLTSKARE